MEVARASSDSDSLGNHSSKGTEPKLAVLSLAMEGTVVTEGWGLVGVSQFTQHSLWERQHAPTRQT